MMLKNDHENDKGRTKSQDRPLKSSVCVNVMLIPCNSSFTDLCLLNNNNNNQAQFKIQPLNVRLLIHFSEYSSAFSMLVKH